MSEYHCKFCDKLFTNVFTTYTDARFGHDIIETYRCVDCCCVFHYNPKTGETRRWLIELDQHGQYDIVIDLDPPKFTVVHHKGGRVYLVFSTAAIPENLTPSNVAEKLKTYILFS